MQIQLNGGRVAIVDACDADRVAQIHFTAVQHRDGTWYARNGKVGWMHRFLLNAPRGVLIDHQDHNGLNNTRHNLRLCNNSENGRNRSGATKRVGRTSQYLGVSWSTQTANWRAVIAAGPEEEVGRASFLDIGRFDSEIMAARAYDAAALLCFGEFASPNFADSTIDPELLKCAPSGEIEQVSSGRFRLRLNRGGNHHERILCGMFDSRETAEAARAALPENTDERRLGRFASILKLKGL